MQRHARARPGPPPGRLGVRWDETRADEVGPIVVEAVTPGSAAERGRLADRRRFLRFAGREVPTRDQFRLRVLAAENPVRSTVERRGRRSSRSS